VLFCCFSIGHSTRAVDWHTIVANSCGCFSNFPFCGNFFQVVDLGLNNACYSVCNLFKSDLFHGPNT
jgi:hypothetical protein